MTCWNQKFSNLTLHQLTWRAFYQIAKSHPCRGGAENLHFHQAPR